MVFACPNPASKANASQHAISSKDQLMAADEARDIATCGCSLMRLANMSDNGETYFYIGRTGWSPADEGAFQKYPPRHSANGRERASLSRNAPKSATDKARLKATAKDAAGTTYAQTPPKGRQFNVYDHPQHYSIWRFEP